MALDFSLLGNGVDLKGVLASYENGRKARIETEKQGALARYSTDPQGAITALMPYDPKAALELRSDYVKQQDRAGVRDVVSTFATDKDKAREKAFSLGPEAVDAYSKLDTAAQKRSHDIAETTGRAAFGALTAAQGDTPDALEARRSFLRPMSKDLVAQGVDPASLEQIIANPTSTALKGVMAKSDAWLKLGVETEQKDREFDAKRDDETWKRGMEGKKFGHTVAVDGARLGLEGQRVSIAAAAEARQRDQGGAGGGNPRKVETDLRKEFDRLPEVKNYRTVATQAATVKQLAKAPPSAQNDIALVYSVMKSYDPTSVVRESEFATAQNAAGVPDQVRNSYNRALNGQRLNPKQRAEMAQSVEAVAQNYKSRFDELANQYSSYATDYGGDPSRVVGSPSASAPQGAPIKTPPKEAGAKPGRNGKFYAPDPNKPGSFPEITVGPDGVWRMKSANGQTLRLE